MTYPAGPPGSRRPRGFDIEPLDEATPPGPPALPPPPPPEPPTPGPAPADPPAPAEEMVVAGEFMTAASALVFAGSIRSIEEVQFGREDATETWWVGMELTLPVARELVAGAGGRLWVYTDRGPLLDQGWGDRPPTTGAVRDEEATYQVDVLDVLRAAGLHQVSLPAPREIALLMPAARMAAVVQRALDLGLAVHHRLLGLESLFSGAGGDTRTVFELRLISEDGPLPGALLTALDRDPCVLVCRRPADALLVQYGLASPLPDRALGVLAAEAGGWLLADVGFGSARWRPLGDGEWQDAANLVRLADQHRLVDVDDGWVAPSEEPPAAPELPPLRLVRARTPVAVDAALLADEDLDCLQALLEGRPLADLAQVVCGRNRHLLLAAGGLLEQLPVGEPLYRLGPGPLYLPLGYRMQPVLPPSARKELLMTEPGTAVVLDDRSAFAFPLQRQEPVWLLWAGALPRVEWQLPPEAGAVVAEVDRLVTEPPPPPAPPPPPPQPPQGRLARIRERLRESFSAPPTWTPPPRTWRDEVREAEQADNFERAADLFERHGELLRAAHMYELAARRDAETRPSGERPERT